MQFDRFSWRWKLPALFAGVAVFTVAAFGVVAYSEAKNSALNATHTRMRSALMELSSIVQLGAQHQLSVLQAAAANPAITEALVHGQAPLSADALAALETLRTKSGVVLGVELIDRNGAVRHADPELTNANRPVAQTIPSATVVDPMYARDSLLYFSGTAPVKTAGKTIGAVRVIRRLGTSGTNRNIIKSLVGKEAVLLLGNRDGALWRYAEEVPNHESKNALVRYSRRDSAWVSASLAVTGTPWKYAVELPEGIALASARAVLLPFIVTGILIAGMGVLLGVHVSRRITVPLIELTAAAEAMARGDRSVSLSASDRRDEIGRMARAFSTMATSVHGVLGQLESDVEVRTAELRTAVERLRQLDGELRQNERLASLGRLYGSVGHELRNPLGVMSNVVLLLDSLPDASPRLGEYARLLREQIRLSQRIISDLLDRARSGAPVYTLVDVSHLVDELVTRAAVPASIRVERNIAPSLPSLVIDREQVGQIVWNLVTNAVQAMRESGGTISIAVSVAEKRLRIEVRDSGKGIDASDVDRIFQPLYTTKTDGVGLGLSISREFARANGGDLFVHPDGPGACFVLELPVLMACDVVQGRDLPAMPRLAVTERVS